MKPIWALCWVMLALAGCDANRAGVVYQNATIDALLDGNYDGQTRFADLARRGDFGLGTFNELDGEMVALEGRFWQMTAEGNIRPVHSDVKTPFSAVVFFRPDRRDTIEAATTYPALQTRVDALRPNAGRAYAVQIRGAFSTIKVRSVPKQTAPYRALAEVVKEQAVFSQRNVSGTLVGFWFPESLRHVNVPGYHFHFISDDRKFGGHVLDAVIEKGAIELQEIRRIELELEPQSIHVRSTGRRENELDAVEKLR